MPNFETFTKRLVPLNNRPYVTIQRRGTISMNQVAFERLTSPDAVELLYDADAHIVGLRAVDPATEHAYPVRAAGANGRSYLIAGTAFAKHYDIDTSVSRRWEAEFEDSVLLIDLNRSSTEVSGNRADHSVRP